MKIKTECNTCGGGTGQSKPCDCSVRKERDRFLTEAIGYKIHTDGLSYPKDEPRLVGPLNFSTWDNFGKLWTWVKSQDWYCKFVFDQLRSGYACYPASKMNIPDKFINPDEFAKAVYEYLKSKT